MDEILSKQGYNPNEIKTIKESLSSHSINFSDSTIDESTLNKISSILDEVVKQTQNLFSKDKGNKKKISLDISEDKLAKDKSKNVFYEGNDINFFNNFDKQNVSLLFQGEGKEDVLKFFKDFVSEFNELMTKLTRDTLDLNTLEDLSNDIEPYYNALVAQCSSLSSDGAQIKNFC